MSAHDDDVRLAESLTPFLEPLLKHSPEIEREVLPVVAAPVEDGKRAPGVTAKDLEEFPQQLANPRARRTRSR